MFLDSSDKKVIDDRRGSFPKDISENRNFLFINAYGRKCPFSKKWRNIIRKNCRPRMNGDNFLYWHFWNHRNQLFMASSGQIVIGDFEFVIVVWSYENNDRSAPVFIVAG